jgi:DNA polymerase III epsilon subunit-like protein
MNYIVFDLEFNQAYKDKSEINPKCPFEIIQIGAVKLDKNLNTTASFDQLVKPEIYTEINPYVKEITKLSEDDLKTSKPFKEVFSEFIHFIESQNNILCVWGMADIKELFRNAEYYKLDINLIPKEYINLQPYVSKHFSCPPGVNIGLSTAADLLNIELNNQFHNAINDANYTAEIFAKLYSDKIKTKLYEPDKQKHLRQQHKTKNKVDIYNLIKQFEKMFNRPMTEDEKKIIKLAYMMGKTNQFQSSHSDNAKK